MSAEHGPPSEQYSGDDFFKDLGTGWGGRLYFGVNPQYQEGVLDISSTAYKVLSQIYELHAKYEKLPEFTISTDIAVDFRNHLITCLPHKEEGRDRIHLLACPFCRGLLEEWSETFLRECLHLPRDVRPLVVDDYLPFKLEGLENEVFKTITPLPTLEDYFENTKLVAGDLAQMLALNEEQRNQFEEEFKRTMDRYKNYTRLAEQERDDDLHPMIRVMSMTALMQYISKRQR